MNKRPIVSTFYRGKNVVKNNHSLHANNAVVNALKHMQVNQYNATHVEVFSEETGKLYAVMKWGVKTLTIIYKSDIENFVKGEE